MQEVGKIFLFVGVALVLVGILFLTDKQSFLGKLPGDIVIKRENFTFYFPFTSSILLSIFLSLVFLLISFWRGR